MSITLTKNSTLGIYIPTDSSGIVVEDYCSFLLVKKSQPNSLYSGTSPRSGSKASKSESTARNTAYKFKYLVDILEREELSPYSIEITVIEAILDMMHEEGFTGESISTYVSVWRQFYKHLDNSKISHNVDWPPLVELDGKATNNDKENDFLSHVNKKSASKTMEPLIPSSWLTDNPTYCDSVLSLKEFWDFYSLLCEIDQVYGTIAITMLQTLLRSGGVVQFPKVANKLNPHWQRSQNLLASGREFQYLNFINKGGKTKEIVVTTDVMELIHGTYIEPHYAERKRKYTDQYLSTKHAKKKGITDSLSNNYLWLNENGTPVSQYMIQKAFRKASEKFHRRVYPHMLRHTGATLLLLNYEKAVGTELMLSMTHDIHWWLQLQLCHNNYSTTEKYIKTVKKIRGEASALLFLPKLKIGQESSLPKNIREVFKRHIDLHHKRLTELTEAA